MRKSTNTKKCAAMATVSTTQSHASTARCIRAKLVFPLPSSTTLPQFGNISVGGPGFLVNYHDDEKDLNVLYEITTVTGITLLKMNGGLQYQLAVASRANSAPHIEGIRTCILDTRHVYKMTAHSACVDLEPIPNSTVRHCGTNDRILEAIADGFVGSQ